MEMHIILVLAMMANALAGMMLYRVMKPADKPLSTRNVVAPAAAPDHAWDGERVAILRVLPDSSTELIGYRPPNHRDVYEAKKTVGLAVFENGVTVMGAN